MGWKMVRDRNEIWSRAHGVSGEWRTCEEPLDSIRKKVLEEIGEWLESGDPSELYDIADVLQESARIAGCAEAPGRPPLSFPFSQYGSLLCAISPWVTRGNVHSLSAARHIVTELITAHDPLGTYSHAHDMKVAAFGKFSMHIEWTPLPMTGGAQDIG